LADLKLAFLTRGPGDTLGVESSRFGRIIVMLVVAAMGASLGSFTARLSALPRVRVRRAVLPSPLRVLVRSGLGRERSGRDSLGIERHAS
jgi:hypothetical protein